MEVLVHNEASGTRSVGSIAQATAIARSGDVIELGPGSYDEAFSLADGVTLRGAGANETVLSPRSSTPAGAVVEVTGNDVRIEGCSFVGGADAAVLAQGVSRLLIHECGFGSLPRHAVCLRSSTATISASRLQRHGSAAITLDGSQLWVADCVFDGLDSGTAIDCTGGVLKVERCHILDAGCVLEGVTVNVDREDFVPVVVQGPDSAVRRCEFQGNVAASIMAKAQRVEIAECTFFSSGSDALSIAEGAYVEVSDCRFAAHPRHAIAVSGGSQVAVRRCTFESPPPAAIFATIHVDGSGLLVSASRLGCVGPMGAIFSKGSSVAVENSVFDYPDGDFQYPAGVVLNDGSRGTISGCVFGESAEWQMGARIQPSGVSVWEGSVAEIDDCRFQYVLTGVILADGAASSSPTANVRSSDFSYTHVAARLNVGSTFDITVASRDDPALGRVVMVSPEVRATARTGAGGVLGTFHAQPDGAFAVLVDDLHPA